MTRARLLLHPAVTGAVAILALNDHVLKPAFGTWWTGKLSDLAGVFVVAVVVAVACCRPGAAIAATGIGFLALKTVPHVAVLAAPLLGGVTVRDPTDLVALVALWPAYRLAGGRPARPSLGVAAGPVLTSVGAVSLLLTLTATSGRVPDVVDGFVDGGDGRTYARVASDYGDPRWAVTADGGRTWVAASAPPPVTDVIPSLEACDGGACFRLVDGDRVEERTADGDWRPAFSFSAEQRRRMEARDGSGCGTGRLVDLRAITTSRQPDGLHVMVAAADQGVLERAPDGDWHRRAVLDRAPLSTAGPIWLARLQLAPFVLLLLSPVPLLFDRARRGLLTFLAAAGIALGVASFGGALLFFGVDYSVAGPLLAALSVAVFVGSVVVARGGFTRR